MMSTDGPARETPHAAFLSSKRTLKAADAVEKKAESRCSRRARGDLALADPRRLSCASCGPGSELRSCTQVLGAQAGQLHCTACNEKSRRAEEGALRGFSPRSDAACSLMRAETCSGAAVLAFEASCSESEYSRERELETEPGRDLRTAAPTEKCDRSACQGLKEPAFRLAQRPAEARGAG
jgi:hypothetical protein